MTDLNSNRKNYATMDVSSRSDSSSSIGIVTSMQPLVDPPKETITHKRTASPFFRPSSAKPVILTETISTPNGKHTLSIKKKTVLRNKSGTVVTDELEKKSSIIGTYANLVNTIVGAGIIGIPYAIKETGLVAGLFLIFSVAGLTDKSLRLLIETGKHVGVQSYETLMEAAFGKAGFLFISINMLIMTFGAMIAYLLVVKDTIPSVLGVDQQDEFQKRVVLFICALTIMLPLSLQRDMADLAKTSAISVFFNFCMIFIIAICSPVKESIDQVGGVEQMLKHSIVKPDTLFVGLGVFSFAFVCQDSSFIIAGSLSQPTRKRWGIVTRSSLLTCAILATFLGLTGYVGFQGATEGNILNNFDNISPDEMVLGIIPMKVAIDVARALIGLAMFSVYPLASYVGRHVLIVLLFSGRQAHEGDDHTVLARDDRRIILTLVLFVAAIVPAILYNDTGVVFSITGAVAGSCLSYLGPGAAYLAVHGQEFLALANWNVSPATRQVMWKYPIPDERKEMRGENYGSGFFGDFYRLVAWWVLLMPIWCVLASTGVKHLEKFEEERLRKSPAVQQRLGMVRHRPAPEPVSSNRDAATGLPGGPSRFEIFKKKSISFDERIIRNRAVDDDMTETHRLLEQRQILLPPSSVGKTVGSKETDLDETVELVRASEGCTSVSYSRDHQGEDDNFVENDPQGDVPTVFDFVVSISYMILGSIALSAGLWSISNT